MGSQAAATDRVCNCSCSESLLIQPGRSVEAEGAALGLGFEECTGVCAWERPLCPVGAHSALPATLSLPETGCCSHPRKMHHPQIPPDYDYTWEVSPQDLFQCFLPKFGIKSSAFPYPPPRAEHRASLPNFQFGRAALPAPCCFVQEQTDNVKQHLTSSQCWQNEKIWKNAFAEEERGEGLTFLSTGNPVVRAQGAELPSHQCCPQQNSGLGHVT